MLLGGARRVVAGGHFSNAKKVFEKGLRKRSRCDREVSERDFVVSVGGVHEGLMHPLTSQY